MLRRGCALGVLFSIACSGGDPGGDPKARILKLSATPETIALGEEVQLEWELTGVEDVIIEPRIGLRRAKGTATDRPLVTTTYVLTVPAGPKDLTRDVTVVVTGGDPIVTSFNASPRTLAKGESATLEWTTADAEEVGIDPLPGARPPQGSLQVSPEATTTYALVARRGSQISAPSQVTIVVVESGDQPSILRFDANPQTIQQGAGVTLTGEAANSDFVTIDQGIGQQPVVGSIEVTPESTTTYRLTAVGRGGEASATVTVQVIGGGDPSILRFDATPQTILPGDESELSWETDDADGVEIDQGIGPQAAKDSVVVSPAQTTRYTLTAFGNGRQVTAQVEVVVAAPNEPVVLGFQATPSSMLAGGSATLDWTTANVTSVDIDNGVGTGLPANGSVQVSPAATTTYRLTAHGASSSAMSTVSITVTPQPARVVSFTANPATITSGAQSTLTWTTADATSVSIDNGVGSQPANGSVAVSPTQTTQYTLTAVGPGGSATAQVSVSVMPVPAISGETCVDPVMVPAAGGSFQSTTAGLANDYNPPASCTGYAAAAPDQAYAISVAAGDVVEAVASFQAGLDGSLYAVSDCADLSSCVAGSDGALAGQQEGLRFVARTAGTRYLIVDGFAAGDSGQHELTVARWGGETCADAAPLAYGTTEWFTTQGKQNDYSPGSGGCTRYAATGPDRAYAILMFPGEQLHVSTTAGAGFDASLYLVSSCADVPGTCVAGSDRTVGGGAEEIAPVFQQSGTYYVIVDGYGGTSGTGEITARIRGGDTCADAYVVPAAGGTFRGTTTGFAADYGTTQSTGSCTGFTQTGADAVYRIDLAAGQRITATLTTTWDAALYLISSCATSATTCVAGQDNGNPETITYTNGTGAAATYYLVVDSWRPSDTVTRTGSYTLDINFQ